MPSGGYQQPSNPAPASGPGKLARRTDSGPAQKLRELPDAEYGEAATYRDLQKSAPLAQTPPAAAPGGGSAGPSIVPFNSPTDRPDEPVTAGASAGAGPDMSALGLPGEFDELKADVAQLRPYLPVLEFMANRPGASPSARNWVRRLKGAL